MDLRSVTDQNSLDEFLTTAQLAGTDFAAGHQASFHGCRHRAIVVVILSFRALEYCFHSSRRQSGNSLERRPRTYPTGTESAQGSTGHSAKVDHRERDLWANHPYFQACMDRGDERRPDRSTRTDQFSRLETKTCPVRVALS